MIRQTLHELVNPEEEVFLQCMKCDFCEILEKGEFFEHLTTYSCPNCKFEFCPHCTQRSHPQRSCAEFKDWLANDEEQEKLFDEFMKGEKYQKCPHCKSNCSKIDGCQYITCQSRVCKGSKAFCYLCGTSLTEAEHFSHFFQKPFGDECLNVNQRVNGEPPKTEAQPQVAPPMRQPVPPPVID